MKSITTKTLSVVTAIMLVIGIAVTMTMNWINGNKLDQEFANYKQNLTTQMSVILQEPVYVYDSAVSQAILESFGGDHNITAISVVDQRGKELANISKGAQSDEVLSIDLDWEGSVIGKVSISLTHQFTNQQLTALTQQTVISILVILVLVGAAVVLTLQKLVLKPLNGVNQVLADIAGGGGDLTARIPVNSDDEIGQLATSFNAFITTVQEIVKDMSGAAHRLSQVTGNVQAIKDQTVSSTNQQSALTESSATSMHELDSATQEIASNTESAVAKANQAKDVAAQSQVSVRANIDNISSLVANLEGTANEVSSLKNASDNIGSVLDVIKGIAEQTNLLALNAAIEAARAGESGRGFAVVADEVRALASKTHDSTEEIESIIQELQVRAEASFKATQESKSMVSQTIDTASRTGEALTQITQEIEFMSDMIMTISSACEEQSVISNLVSKDMGNLASGSEKLAQNSEVLDAETMNLVEVGDQMIGQVKRFSF